MAVCVQIKQRRKKFNCSSFFCLLAEKNESTSSIYLTYKCGNWEHNHPITQEFLIGHGMISQTKIAKIINLAKQGASYKEIRKADDFSLIPVNKFYDIRRNILKNTIETQIPDYLEKCELMTTHFKIFIIGRWTK